jgi:hypothetical protein
MGTRSSFSLSPDEAGVQRLAEDLRTETSAIAILSRLEALIKGLTDKQMADKVARAFMRAGGLPILICHLRGSATSPSAHGPHINPLPPKEAGLALLALLRSQNAIKPELQAATDVIMPLIDVVRGGILPSRFCALNALLVLAIAHPGHLKAIAEAGGMRLLLDLYVDLGDQPSSVLAAVVPSSELAARLGQRLLESGPVAPRELEQAIRSPHTVQTFSALVLFQVALSVCILQCPRLQ